VTSVFLGSHDTIVLDARPAGAKLGFAIVRAGSPDEAGKAIFHVVAFPARLGSQRHKIAEGRSWLIERRRSGSGWSLSCRPMPKRRKLKTELLFLFVDRAPLSGKNWMRLICVRQGFARLGDCLKRILNLF
jgi:hypothetical protein